MTSSKPLFLKEDRAHGSHSFRCGFYTTNPKSECFHVPLHWHEEIELVHFISGHFSLEINMEKYDIDSECFFFIRSGELHRIVCEEPCCESALVFSPYLLCFLSNDDAQGNLLLPLAKGDLVLPRKIEKTDSCYEAILSEYKKLAAQYSSISAGHIINAPQQLFIKAALLNILGYLSAAQLLHTCGSQKNENIESIKMVLSYIHTHYSEKIFISDLAGLLNLNEQYFCRFYKKATGQSPIAYLNEYRIRRATALLTETSMQITDICLECGFNNFGNFLREFRKQTSMTPSGYRRTFQKI